MAALGTLSSSGRRCCLSNATSKKDGCEFEILGSSQRCKRDPPRGYGFGGEVVDAAVELCDSEDDLLGLVLPAPVDARCPGPKVSSFWMSCQHE